MESPAQSVEPPSSGAKELKRKGSETDRDGDSLLLNSELAVGAVSSILKDFDFKRSGALPVEEALAISLQGVASVSSRIFPCLILTLSWVLILCWVWAGGYSFEEFSQKGQFERGPCQSR